MSDGDFPFFVTAVVIFAITAAVVAYSIKKLAKTPGRLVAVLGAVASLITALATLIASLHPASPQTIDQPPPTAATACVTPAVCTAAPVASQ